MSDDLMKRLCSLHKQATVDRSHFYVGWCVKDAMHRIEELETKLAKAVEALEYYSVEAFCLGADNSLVARTTLAELKGRDDE